MVVLILLGIVLGIVYLFSIKIVFVRGTLWLRGLLWGLRIVGFSPGYLRSVLLVLQYSY